MSDRAPFLLIALLAALFFSFFNLTFYETASIFLFVYFLLRLISSVGVTYDLLTIPILLLVFECLIMPSVVYNNYNDDYIIIALRYSMSVPKEQYYSFVFPATIAMIIGMKLPLMSSSERAKRIGQAIENCKTYLKGKGNLGVLLIIIGATSGVLEVFTPGELRYVLYLFGRLIIVGVFYVFYSDGKLRIYYLFGALLFILFQSLAVGMFGDLIYTLLLGGMLISLSFKVNNYYKYLFAFIGFFVILLIQNVKSDFRKSTWVANKESVDEATVFLDLISDRIGSTDRFFDKDLMFPTVNRFNQGMIVSKVLDHVPKFAPFAEGETVFGSIAATFVPRLLWPEKPLAGGHYNMLRFTGLEIVGYSMNVGVIGEAYGNFGVNGGIFFMFLFGLFFNIIFYRIILASKKTPTIILWIPFIFLNAVQAETDTLMTINSTIKNLIFIYFCYWAADRFLRLKL